MSCYYGNELAVSNLSMEVENGIQVCLLGPSGCGKTTVLRAIAGFHQLDNGYISIDDTVVSSPTVMSSPEKRRIGMVFQDHALFPHLSVYQNVVSGLRNHSQDEKRQTVSELLERMSLESMSSRFPHELSGGQQQRVALARALAPNPLVLLMDEPFSGLDRELRERMCQEVSEMLKDRGTTCVMVTHDQSDAFNLGEMIGIMKGGAITQWDNPYNIYHRPNNRFVANFIGDGVFIKGDMKSNTSVSTDLGLINSSKQSVSNVSSNVEVLVRPDDVVFDPDGPIVAQVLRRAFKGAQILYTLQANNIKLLALFASHKNFNIGESVSVRIALDELIVFPR